MKRFILSLTAVAIISSAAAAQQPSKSPPPQSPDATLVEGSQAAIERDSLHNLEVARTYFKRRHAYIAALARVEEIIAGNPTFGHMDEALYIAGASSLRLAENRGKQSSKTPPEKLREDGRNYLTQLLKSYPDSHFRKAAEDELRQLGGVPATPGK